MSKGGKRAGSGAKLKYGEKTRVVTFRVPESRAVSVRETVNRWLKKFESKIL